MPFSDVTYLVGNASVAARPAPPFDDGARDFLADLSSALRNDARAKTLPDLQTFAFWCRPANFDRLKADFGNRQTRLGRGMVFHIAPSNVPVNAAYTFAFGLLAGNSNIVRLPSRPFPQIEILCDIVNQVLEQPRHASIKAVTAFVRYPHDAAITEKFSAACGARVIWGGDDTVREIRKIALPERAVELAFADRYSLCVLKTEAVASASNEQLTQLADAFYNDTYLMDQNACSSPQLVLWLGRGDAAKNRFWDHVQKRVAVRYDLPAVHAVDKYSMLLDAAMDLPLLYTRRYHNYVYIVGVDDLSDAENRLRGKFGLFYEKTVDSLDALASVATAKSQTLTYYGCEKDALRDIVLKHRLSGIDRIVPVGRALDIDVIWDGYDIIGMLSRIVDAR